MLILYQQEVLAIIGRQAPNTLLEWHSVKRWFPPPNFPGRPPRWTEKTLLRWINEEIPALFESGAGMPELASQESTLAYQAACLGRLEYMKEKRERQSRIMKVYRKMPQTA